MTNIEQNTYPEDEDNDLWCCRVRTQDSERDIQLMRWEIQDSDGPSPALGEMIGIVNRYDAENRRDNYQENSGGEF